MLFGCYCFTTCLLWLVAWLGLGCRLCLGSLVVISWVGCFPGWVLAEFGGYDLLLLFEVVVLGLGDFVGCVVQPYAFWV